MAKTATEKLLTKREFASRLVDADPGLFPTRTVAEDTLTVLFRVLDDVMQTTPGVRFVGHLTFSKEQRPPRKVTYRNFRENTTQTIDKPGVTRPKVTLSKSWRDRLTVVDAPSPSPARKGKRK